MSLASPYFAPSPARRAEVLLYVDFDGVLHHEAVLWHHRRGIYMSQKEAAGRVLFEWVGFLESIALEFPHVGLVLSSTWCVRPGFGKALKFLPRTLAARFIGGTFHRRHHGADEWTLQAFRTTPRWKQILGDVERRQPRAWLALDDDVEDWPDHLRENLIACDGSTGLSSFSVREELEKKLRSFASSTLPPHA